MHNLTKIKLFRVLLYICYPIALIVLYPIVLLKKKHRSGLFFFFDRYAIGGAQRIHLDLLAAIPDINKRVYFTRFSANDKLKDEFYSIENSTSKDIHFWCDNLLIRLFTVHYYCFYINRHKCAHVFSSNSTFFYDMLPFLNKGNVTTTELLHNFTHGKNGMEFFGLANHQYLTNRIVYDSYTLSNIKKQYQSYHVGSEYLDRIHFIEPGVNMPDSIPAKQFAAPLKVLYAGRGGAQKRIHLLNKVVQQLIENKAPLEFHFAGSIAEDLSEYVQQNAVMHGEISSPKAMYELYKGSHIILMTSAYEGFPMLIKEGMANGCVPVVTALEGNKMHLTHNENALLIGNIEDEDYVVHTAVQLLTEVCAHKYNIETLSNNAYEYAKVYFDKNKFNEKYRAFFNHAQPNL